MKQKIINIDLFPQYCLRNQVCMKKYELEALIRLIYHLIDKCFLLLI